MTSVQKKATRERLERQLNDNNISASQISPELVTGYKGIYNRYVKRGLDFILALVLFIVVLPILLVISAMIVADSGRPVCSGKRPSGRSAYDTARCPGLYGELACRMSGGEMRT